MAKGLYLYDFWKEVRVLAIKEMPLEEKYDRLLDAYYLNIATLYALHKELGVGDKCIDWSVKVQKKMVPSVWGVAFKLLKAISPGKAFGQVVDQYVYMMQTTQPLSGIELTKVSDREVTVRVKNCSVLGRMRDVVKKAGLDLDPRFMCEFEPKINREVAKEFGVDLTCKLEGNGCIHTAKLR